ncbi:MAG: ankyrin repeat domain-containing protein [Wolbachia endosymbiont of Andrena nigroaenea]|nr:ankyrin repeat domain-containing protein [Wolbachia endosymbiont of Andrena nigroaenea]
MAMKYDQWKRILSTVNEEGNLSKDNVIEKIREKLSRYSDEYKEWDEASFNVNHLFHAPDNPFLREKDKCTLLHLAARNNLENITEALLGVEGVDINAIDEPSAWIPLHWAARFNSEKVIDILLKAEKINVSAENCRKSTPLHIAAHYGSEKAIDALLKAKDIDVNVKNQDDETPLHYAAQFCNEGAISALLRAKDIDINAIDKDNKTPLHVVASDWGGGEEALNILIKGGANVKAVDKDGNTPLHLVASHYSD